MPTVSLGRPSGSWCALIEVVGARVGVVLHRDFLGDDTQRAELGVDGFDDGALAERGRHDDDRGVGAGLVDRLNHPGLTPAARVVAVKPASSSAPPAPAGPTARPGCSAAVATAVPAATPERPAVRLRPTARPAPLVGAGGCSATMGTTGKAWPTGLRPVVCAISPHPVMSRPLLPRHGATMNPPCSRTDH